MMGRPAKDLAGTRFGMLTIVQRAASPSGPAYWECRCDCGNVKTIRGTSLRARQQQSCGCLNAAKPKVKDPNTRHIDRHGMVYSVLYRKHRNALKVRSINGEAMVCDEWKQFRPFMEWALANDYADELTLARKDIQAQFSPSNCVWRFLRKRHTGVKWSASLTYFGETKTAAQWAKDPRIHLSSVAIIMRKKRGMSDHDALSIPRATSGNTKKTAPVKGE